MNPSVPDRIGSAIRALSYVVLPSLPPEASLAREQTQLVIGHLQIIMAQYDATPDFEEQEAESFVRLARDIINVAAGGAQTISAKDALASVVDGAASSRPLARTQVVQDGLDDLLLAVAVDGEPAAHGAIKSLILAHAKVRADTDRRWFSLMGFDPDINEKMKASA